MYWSFSAWALLVWFGFSEVCEDGRGEGYRTAVILRVADMMGKFEMR